MAAASSDHSTLTQPTPSVLKPALLVSASLLAALWIAWFSYFPAPGRSAPTFLLIAGTVYAGFLFLRNPALPSSANWHQNPLIWLGLTWIWQALTTVWHAHYWEPPAVILTERLAAIFTAIAVFYVGLRQKKLPAIIGTSACLWLIAAAILLIGVNNGDLGFALALGMEAPFGNPNFAIGSFLPLLPLALCARTSLWPLTALAVIAAVAVGLGLTTRYDDAVYAVWPIAAAMGISWFALGMRSTKASLTILGLCAAITLAGQILLTTATITWDGAPPSAINRLGVWAGSWQAWLEAPIVGHGVGSASVVIPPQQGFWPGWLAVPGFPEHSHHELLQALLDGGLINLALLGLVGWWTIQPLWAQRHQRHERLILTAICATGAAATLESHLGQPGPLLILAALTGCAWSRQNSTVVTENTFIPYSKSIALSLLAALMASSIFLLYREHLGYGSVGVQWGRTAQAVAATEKPQTQNLLWRELQIRVGALDMLYVAQAEAILSTKQENTSTNRIRKAAQLLIMQAMDNPCHPWLSSLGTATYQQLVKQNDITLASQLKQALHQAELENQKARKKYTNVPKYE